MIKLRPFLELNRIEAGCDEAGRGCLAGPVVAAAVILDKAIAEELDLNDSKQLTAKKRDELRVKIEEKSISWAVSFVPHDKIDEINILQASFLAMRQSVEKLHVNPDYLLIDGNRFVSSDSMPPHSCIVKGDAKFSSIAAASILAKTHRDDFMLKQDEKWPGYSWDSNFGYPTIAHRLAIDKLGPTPIHRISFKLF
jgi:ribonuclease HII